MKWWFPLETYGLVLFSRQTFDLIFQATNFPGPMDCWSFEKSRCHHVTSTYSFAHLPLSSTSKSKSGKAVEILPCCGRGTRWKSFELRPILECPNRNGMLVSIHDDSQIWNYTRYTIIMIASKNHINHDETSPTFSEDVTESNLSTW